MTTTTTIKEEAAPRRATSFARAVQAVGAPVDGASMALVRIAFGLIMLWEVGRYFAHDWIQAYYITPSFHFTYYGFGWVRPWPGPGMHLHFLLLGAAALAIAAGWRYRLATSLFFLGFTYVFLLDQARYLNHFYLICLLSLVLAIVPAAGTWSLDARRRGDRPAPAWSLWLLRFQVGIPYFFAGVAKLNADWLRGEPLRTWMAARSGLPAIGPFMTAEPVVALFAYGSILLDLAIVPALLWRRTRAAAFAAACTFHLLNAQLFTIGVFPFLMIAATTIFFAPDWPRRFVPRGMLSAASVPSASAVRPLAPAAAAALLAYAALQLLVPLRHLAYPGDVAWTEEGHRFSWRMKLRDKSGEARFVVIDPASGETREADWRRDLASWQYREMVGRPDMLLQYAHHLASETGRAGGRLPEVRADVVVSLNGRPRATLIDPTVDLGAQPRTLAPARWIRRPSPGGILPPPNAAEELHHAGQRPQSDPGVDMRPPR